MKTKGKYMNTLVFFFAILIFFQSCTIYEKSSVSLEWAAKQELKAKVKMKGNQIYKFKRIRFENEQFYGIQKINGEIIKMPLLVNELNKIQVQDKSLTAIASAALVLGSLVSIILIWYFIDTGGGNWLDLSE